MTYTKLNQRGISHIFALLLVLVVAAVGFGAYRVMNASKANTSTQKAAATAVPDTFKTKSDVEQASRALDENDVNKDVNPSQFDTDINSML